MVIQLDNYLTVAEAAAKRECTRDSIHKLIKRGRLKASRKGRAILIRASDLDRVTEGKSGRPKK